LVTGSGLLHPVRRGCARSFGGFGRGHLGIARCDVLVFYHWCSILRSSLREALNEAVLVLDGAAVGSSLLLGPGFVVSKDGVNGEGVNYRHTFRVPREERPSSG